MTLHNFPQDGSACCPVCGTSDDRPCVELRIDDTLRDGSREYAPTHADCLATRLDLLRYNRAKGFIYLRVRRGRT